MRGIRHRFVHSCKFMGDRPHPVWWSFMAALNHLSDPFSFTCHCSIAMLGLTVHENSLLDVINVSTKLWRAVAEEWILRHS
jgi:hypothetical protein